MKEWGKEFKYLEINYISLYSLMHKNLFKEIKHSPKLISYWFFVLQVLVQDFFFFGSNIFISFITLFFLFGTWEYKFPLFFFSQPLFPFPHCIYNIHSPLITTPILTIMKCQLSQDQGSSWFFGLKGLSPMWGSKENYHGFSL